MAKKIFFNTPFVVMILKFWIEKLKMKKLSNYWVNFQMKGILLSTQLQIMNLVPFWMCHCSVIDNFEKVLFDSRTSLLNFAFVIRIDAKLLFSSLVFRSVLNLSLFYSSIVNSTFDRVHFFLNWHLPFLATRKKKRENFGCENWENSLNVFSPECISSKYLVLGRKF